MTLHVLEFVVGLHDHVGHVNHVIGAHGTAVVVQVQHVEKAIEKVQFGDFLDDLDDHGQGEESGDDGDSGGEDVSGEDTESAADIGVETVGTDVSAEVEAGLVRDDALDLATIVKGMTLTTAECLSLAGEALVAEGGAAADVRGFIGDETRGLGSQDERIVLPGGVSRVGGGLLADLGDG